MLAFGPNRSTTQTGVATNHIVNRIKPGTISRMEASPTSSDTMIASPMMGKNRSMPTLQRLAQADRPAAHVLERPVQDDRLAERIEHDRQQDADERHGDGQRRGWSRP